MEGLDTYLLALGLYVTLRGLFKVYMNYYDHKKGALIALAFLSLGVANAQKHYPLAEGQQVVQIGEVSTLELYRKVNPETKEEHLIFYNSEGDERWAAIILYKYEIDEFYKILEQGILGMHSRFGVRGAHFTFYIHGLSKTEVYIVDSYGQSFYMKINRPQLRRLFNK